MKGRKGFSLIEAVVALILIGIIAVSGFEFLRHCQKFLTHFARTNLEAAELARETMEAIYWGPGLEVTPDGIHVDIPDGAMPHTDDPVRGYFVEVPESESNYYLQVWTVVEWE